MKKRLFANWLPAVTFCLGLMGLLLRVRMYATCVDGRGLLEQGNLYHISTWILTVLTVAILTVATGRRNGTASYPANFPSSLPAAIGCWLGAVGIGVTVLFSGSDTAGLLTLLWKIAGILSAVTLILAGNCRRTGKKPYFALYAAVCVFFALHLICYYQVWSGEPQTPDYSFQLLACVMMTLFSYYQTAFCVDTGSRRCQLLTGLLGMYLSCLALAQTDTPWLYIGGIVWLLTNLCSLAPPKRRRFADAQEVA